MRWIERDLMLRKGMESTDNLMKATIEGRWNTFEVYMYTAEFYFPGTAAGHIYIIAVVEREGHESCHACSRLQATNVTCTYKHLTNPGLLRFRALAVPLSMSSSSPSACAYLASGLTQP